MNHRINRRQFQAIAASSTLAFSTAANAQPAPQPAPQMAFLSDTHIDADTNTVARGIRMAEHLEQVVGQVVDALPSGSHVIVNGDCAYLKGLPGDYATFAELVAPLNNAGLQLHVTMGNHDDRGPLYQALNDQQSNDVAVEDKHVDVIRLGQTDVVLLDSLWKVNQVTGEIGAAQLQWLKEFLAADTQRPVVVVGHHNLQFSPPAGGKAYSGVKDTAAFTTLLQQHPRVKAYFYGHTHRWENRVLDGDAAQLHLVNLPAVAYVFDAKQPSGWVQGTFSDSELRLRINTLDRSHPNSDEELRVSLKV